MEILLKEITPNESNPRFIRDEAFLRLKRSVAQFPAMLQKRGLAVRKKGKKWETIGGNMRFRALTDLQAEIADPEKFKKTYKVKAKEIQVLESYFAEGIPCIDCSEFTEEEVQRFVIADNVPFGEWDTDVLANEWSADDLAEWGLDIEFAQPEPEAFEDDYQIPDEIETDIVLGDLFEIGPHRLLCGDSTKVEDVERLMNGVKAEIVFTSPPYNLGKNVKLSTRDRRENAYTSYNDNKNHDEYFLLLKAFTDAYLGHCENMLINIQSLAGNKKAVIDYQFQYKSFIADIAIWYKVNPQPVAAKKVMNSAFEYIIILSNSECPTRAITTANFHGTFPNVYVGTVNSENVAPGIHSAAFPLSMCRDFIDAFCNKTVIDCFLGTGTTMVAAHQLNRVCYGMELDPKYCQIIVDRMLKLDPALEVKKNGQPYQSLVTHS